MRIRLFVSSAILLSCFFHEFQAQCQLPLSARAATPNFGGLLAAPSYATSETAKDPSSANNSLGMVSGDFNHDGLPDLANVGARGTVDVLLNDGKGGFKTALVSSLTGFPALYFPLGKVMSADLNGDGYTDLVIGTNSATALLVALNQGNGTFAATTALPLPYGASSDSPVLFSFTVGPTTPSGFADIIVAQSPHSAPAPTMAVSVFLNDGSGRFSRNVSSSYPVAAGTILGTVNQDFGDTVVLADANHDGIADLFVMRQTSPEFLITYVDVLAGKGDGSFKAPGPDGTTSLTSTNLNVSAFNLAVANLTGKAGGEDILLSDFDGVSVALSNGDGTYRPLSLAVSFPSSFGMKVVDFNGDSKPDLIVDGSGGLSVYLGQGDGTFSAPAAAYVAGKIPEASGYGVPWAVTVEDFDGDGVQDFASADAESGDIEVAKGNGDGTFIATPLLFSAQSPSLTARSISGELVADLNGDGLDDLVAADYWKPSPEVVTGISDGKGNLKYQTALSAAYPLSFVQPIRADFNGDGKQDIVIVGTDHSVAVALSNGDGTLQTPAALPLGKSLACPIGIGASGDLNGDKKPDLVFAYAGDAYCRPYVNIPSGYFVALGNGDGTFQTATFTPYGSFLQSVSLAFFHGNAGHLDMVGIDFGAIGTTSVVFPGKGDGTFGHPSLLTPPQSAYRVLTDDFNADGNADLTLIGIPSPLAPAGSITGSVVWYAGNGDGSFASPVAYNSKGTAYSGKYADLNGDGIVDLTVIEDQGMTVLLGTGSGSFAAPTHYFNPWFTLPVLAGNFLGDNTQSILSFAGDNGGTGFYQNLGGTSLVVTPSATTLHAGDSVSLTSSAMATLTGRPAPSGTITLLDGTTAIGSGAAPNATISVAPLTIGSHSITASYGGDGNFNPNVSAPVALTVTAAPPEFTLAAGTGALTVRKGQSGMLSLTVTPNGSLSGTVSFACSGLPTEANCTFSPASLSVAAGIAATETISVTTKAASTTTQAENGASGVGWAGVLAAECFLLFFQENARHG